MGNANSAEPTRPHEGQGQAPSRSQTQLPGVTPVFDGDDEVFQAKCRADWDDEVNEILKKKPVVIKTFILPPGLEIDDPRLAEGVLRHTRTYTLPAGELPEWDKNSYFEADVDASLRGEGQAHCHYAIYPESRTLGPVQCGYCDVHTLAHPEIYGADAPIPSHVVQEIRDQECRQKPVEEDEISEQLAAAAEPVVTATSHGNVVLGFFDDSPPPLAQAPVHDSKWLRPDFGQPVDEGGSSRLLSGQRSQTGSGRRSAGGRSSGRGTSAMTQPQQPGYPSSKLAGDSELGTQLPQSNLGYTSNVSGPSTMPRVAAPSSSGSSRQTSDQTRPQQPGLIGGQYGFVRSQSFSRSTPPAPGASNQR